VGGLVASGVVVCTVSVVAAITTQRSIAQTSASGSARTSVAKMYTVEFEGPAAIDGTNVGVFTESGHTIHFSR
jgi:hypothetical protein